MIFALLPELILLQMVIALMEDDLFPERVYEKVAVLGADGAVAAKDWVAVEVWYIDLVAHGRAVALRLVPSFVDLSSHGFVVDGYPSAPGCSIEGLVLAIIIKNYCLTVGQQGYNTLRHISMQSADLTGLAKELNLARLGTSVRPS